jgi:hypothetical protein
LPLKDNAASDRVIAEVVLSSTSPVLGLSVKAAQFRTKYGAAVLAVRHLASLVDNPRLNDTVLQVSARRAAARAPITELGSSTGSCPAVCMRKAHSTHCTRGTELHPC